MGQRFLLVAVRDTTVRDAFSQGDTPTARQLVEQTIHFCRKERLQYLLIECLPLLARINTVQGNHATARVQLEESLAIASKLNEVDAISSCLRGIANLAMAQQQYVRSVRILGADETLREAARVPIYPAERADYENIIASARFFLGEQAFATLWAEGRTMTPGEAIAASESRTSTQPDHKTRLVRFSPYPAGLTAREVEVLRLVAQGLTDKQIAERLVLSTRTVTTHLTSIYNKLGISSRAAAARFAAEHQLV